MVRYQEYGLNQPAPAWHIAGWFNANNDLSLEKLRGRVIVLHTFSDVMSGMRCSWDPTGAILARNIRCPCSCGSTHCLRTSRRHAAAALRAFLHEYRVNFPLGVDAHESGQDIPLPIHAPRMYGTPTLILIDRFGIVHYHAFGRPDDMPVAAQMAMLLSERVATGISNNSEDVKQETRAGCDNAGCSLDR